MRNLNELAGALGLGPNDFHPAGPRVAKVPVSVVRARAAKKSTGKLILITGMTPTRHGEGKTVTAIGLADGFSRLKRSAVVCLRQPSLGPIFGVKGGATGGGRSTVEPSAEINLGFTGDIYAVASAHNLLSALVDNHLFHGNSLQVDPNRILWPRTLDMEDRALRHITVGKGHDPRFVEHESSFVITAASEIMVILALARDYTDLKARLGRVIAALTTDGKAVRASDLNGSGAMAALLRDALEPNLVQTAEGTPALVHAGPFGNLAHGTCSRLSIELGLATCEYTIVEAGFATELGAEKFVDIVAPTLGRNVDAAVLVATQRGLRYQGGASDEESDRPNRAALERGLENLAQHLDNIDTYGVPTVVALNQFPGDSAEETQLVQRFCKTRHVEVVEATGFADGGAGAVDLARAVDAAASLGRQSRPVNAPGTPIFRQVDTIATRLYGASHVNRTPEALADLELLKRIGELDGPVCIAKTPLSLSDNPHVLGRPRDFNVTVDRLTRSAGAGFTVVYLGTIETMPGLPTRPAAEEIDLTADGEVTGVH
ncbi:MAG TPA: formate--tetrahydrofolate ligase [Thermoplasmata archaeon]|nr:formate--tetrahydrofolate ligase [Thermoplasmata archaeon]